MVQTTKAAADGYVVLTFKFQREGKRWTAYCDELGTATFGRSLPQAGERIQEAVLCHLNTLEDVGERKRFFKEHGIPFYRTKPSAEVQINVSVDKDIFVQPRIQRIPVGIAC